MKLYSDRRSAVEKERPLEVNSRCRRCDLHRRASPKTVCMRADGEPGGVLFVAESPGRIEDASGRPLVGTSGSYLRGLVDRFYEGPVAYDNAVRCTPGKDRAGDPEIAACRGYLWQTIREVKPERIVCLGAAAAKALLGRSISIFSARGAYSYLSGPAGPIPVFVTMNPAAALRNKFAQKTFEQDLEWILTCNPADDAPRPPWGSDVRRVRTAGDAKAAVTEMREAGWFAFDIESAGLQFDPDYEIISFAACAPGNDSAWVWDRKALANPACLELLKKLMADRTVAKVGSNVKFDCIGVRWAWGVEVQNIRGDVRLWRKLVDPEASGELEDMAELVGMGGHKKEFDDLRAQLITKARKAINRRRKERDQVGLFGGHYSEYEDSFLSGFKESWQDILMGNDFGPDAVAYALMSDDDLSRYNAMDTVSTARLGKRCWDDLVAVPECKWVWDEIVSGAPKAAEHMEFWGIQVDRSAIENLSLFLDSRISEVVPRLSVYGDNEWWTSNDDIGDLLYGKLKLKAKKLTKTGKKSTDKSAIEALAKHHPVVGDLLEFRRLSKLKGTYADGLLPHIRPDGRIHPTFLLDGARSGRLSCKDPNLQNQPRVDDRNADAEQNLVRACFVAPPGHVLLQADYSQLELRVAAYLSGDPLLIDIFRSGDDLHQRTAELISKVAWGIEPSQVTKTHRSLAKAVNFGLLYGQTEYGLAAALKIEVEEAKKIRDAVLGKFVVLAQWMKAQIRRARETGYTWTTWKEKLARRRPLWDIGIKGDGEEDRKRRGEAERSAMNTPVQGMASDLCLASLVQLVSCIVDDGLPAKLVLTVHDSLIFEVAEKDLDAVACEVRSVMSQWDLGEVPVVVDMESGRSWASLKKLEKKPARAQGLVQAAVN